MSSRDVRNDGDDEDDVALVDALAGDGSPPPKPVTATVTNGTTKAELPRRTKAAMSEVGPKTEATPLAAMRVKLRRSGVAQRKSRKPDESFHLSSCELSSKASGNVPSYPTQPVKQASTAEHLSIG